MYSENYKMLMKQIKKDTNRWKDIHTMFTDWKNQYCQNHCKTQGNVKIQCNLHQIKTGIFHRTRTKNIKICMETQKT